VISVRPQTQTRGGSLLRRWGRSDCAFSILELLVAVAVLLIILLIIFSITQQTGNAWKSTNSKIEAFQRARAAFDAITQNLGQATLNTYYDYDDRLNPKRYFRNSDLHFISGKSLTPGQLTHSVFFQTPAGYSDDSNVQGMETLLNACGYFVEYVEDTTLPPFLATLPNGPAVKYRYRLMQFLQPSQNLAVYANPTGNDWFTDSLSSNIATRQMADNIILLLIVPKNSQGADLTTDFEYNSRDAVWTPTSGLPQPTTSNQLPPLVEVIMVAMDEASANRLCTSSTAPDLGLGTLFQDPASIDANLTTFENALSDKHVNFRIFRTTIALRNSKWSS